MKKIRLERATLATCVTDAQRERVLITRNGKPLALVVGVKEMDEQQLRLGSSDRFWSLIAKRRTQKTISRAQLEKRISNKVKH
jgi:prevent-host-death family protein